MQTIHPGRCCGTRRALSILATSTIAIGALGASEATPGDEPLITEEEYNRAGVREGVRDAGSGDLGSLLGDMTLGLVLVIGLAVLVGMVVRRIGRRHGVLRTGGTHMQLVETLPLGFKRAVSMIRVGDRVVLVGTSESGLNQLATFDAAVVTGGADAGDGDAPVAGAHATGDRGTDGAAPTSDPPAAPDAGRGGDPVARFQARLRQALGRGS